MNSLNKLSAEISRPLSKRILTLLQQEKPQKEHELGHKILKLGSDLKHMRITWKVLFKLDHLDALLSEVNQLEGRKLIWALNVKIPNPQGTPTAANLNLLHLLDF